MTKLLSEMVTSLHLDAKAPFPSEEEKYIDDNQNVRTLIKQWRQEQRLKLVHTERRHSVRDPIDFGPTEDYAA